MNWTNILYTELAFAAFILIGLGFVRLPKILRRKQLSRFFPWGYYPEQVPQKDKWYPENDRDFLHDLGTEFGSRDGFGDYGEFSGFGELGEYGDAFWSADIGGSNFGG